MGRSRKARSRSATSGGSGWDTVPPGRLGVTPLLCTKQPFDRTRPDGWRSEDHRRMTDYDVVVIGAGAAGLSAGALLATEGKRVLVADRSPVLGGRAMAVPDEGLQGQRRRPDAPSGCWSPIPGGPGGSGSPPAFPRWATRNCSAAQSATCS